MGIEPNRVYAYYKYITYIYTPHIPIYFLYLRWIERVGLGDFYLQKEGATLVRSVWRAGYLALQFGPALVHQLQFDCTARHL